MRLALVLALSAATSALSVGFGVAEADRLHQSVKKRGDTGHHVVNLVTRETDAAAEEDHDHEEGEEDHDHEEGEVEEGVTFSVTNCHFHDAVQYCIDAQGNEGYIDPDPVPENAPSTYTGCHLHGNATYCMNGQQEVQFVLGSKDAEAGEGEGEEEHDHEEEEHDHDEATFSVTECHFDDDVQYCHDPEGNEGYILPAPAQSNAPSNYTGCHQHDGEDVYCLYGTQEVQFILGVMSASTTSSGQNCHFHAGVEHCEDDSSLTNLDAQACEPIDRDYNIPLRIGLLFVILVTSSIGSFGPTVLKQLFRLSQHNIIVTIIKQFGTGVVISTAFVHLMTHAALIWGNSCLHLTYEATGPAITMAGLFIAFLIEYIAYRLLSKSLTCRNQIANPTGKGSECEEVEACPSHDKVDSETQVGVTSSHSDPDSNNRHPINDKISVLILEAGIIFHSILIGITLVVAADSYFITLFIVIVFHQFFEGLALGSRIADLDSSLLVKCSMALAFALITPLGMGIGIGVLNQFNGNDPSTIIALGTLDSFSAGVLLWTGLIEMWAHDWLWGHLRHAGWLHTGLAMASLVAGLLLMSLLGNWA
ncbi:uncharacterized protein LODBEIA_P39770 [Lodderomyces beijingensis]|uniref:Zinc-regulated transporter 1 n=1 Tax=Lodderomyces beijingensis TaxID=1775926 RepID=A0ABP0ZPY5_9ASCO